MPSDGLLVNRSNGFGGFVAAIGWKSINQLRNAIEAASRQLKWFQLGQEKVMVLLWHLVPANGNTQGMANTKRFWKTAQTRLLPSKIFGYIQLSATFIKVIVMPLPDIRKFPPPWAPDAVPSDRGWRDRKTGELLVSIRGGCIIDETISQEVIMETLQPLAVLSDGAIPEEVIDENETEEANLTEEVEKPKKRSRKAK